jgi:transcriptional regulator with XRE-family HTH domain
MGVGADFGRLLRRYRSTAGLTQEELAERAGLSVRAVSDMERGRTARPLARSVRLLADALGLPEPGRAQLLGALLPAEEAVPGPLAGTEAVTPLPRQLPASLAHFAGRAAELKMLAGELERAAGVAGAVVIAAVGGTAGVGKTALAVQFAHQASEAFPDGQLYVDLRGFGPSGGPATPEEAVRGFLDAAGCRPSRSPLA